VFLRARHEERAKMNKDGLANFFLGLGIGVGIGMLFAPKSGQETRGLLMDKADEGKEYLRQQTSKLGDSANDLLGKGRDIIGKQKENLNDAIEAGKQAYREKVEPAVSSNLS
jgi:gas vesicle protein